MTTNSAKPKILIFSLVYYPRFIGGAEVAVKEITDRLGDEYDFDMITIRKGDLKYERIGKVSVYRVGFGWRSMNDSFFSRIKIDKYLFPFFAFFEAIKLNGQNNYDLTWSIMANYAGFGALFFKLFNPKIPFLLTLQEGDPIPYIKRKVWFVYPLFKLIFKKANKIQAISKFLADFGRSMGHKEPIKIIPNGVDLDVFSQKFSDNTKIELRNIIGKNSGDIFLVTTSRLVYKNATDDIIKALTYLPKNISLVVIGKGIEGSLLQRQANDLGMGERVKFLGFLPSEEIPKYFSICDIFVRPSRSEGFGNSFIEAMASSLPVVATPVGGIVDFISDKETGVFCSPDNPQSIAEAVKLIINDKDLREKIIYKAKFLVTENYSWDRIAMDMRDLVFDRLLK